ncbi:MAG: transporter substrate-binding domain-containing protein [Actinobacteria bacterium]|nr:transporter substrate-binding domain-containing protein [Actinomycetota bacterium]
MTRTSLRAALAAALVGTAAIAAYPALASPAAAPPTTLTPGTLTICTYPGFAPFTSFDASGAWVGWHASFLIRFATQQGLAVKTVSVVPFDGIWKRPGENQCDIAAAGIADQPAHRARAPGGRSPTTW